MTPEEKDKKLTQYANVAVDEIKTTNSKEYEWHKNSLTAACSLLAILVAFHTEKSEDVVEHVAYSITIASMSLGILFSAIYLYADSHTSQKLILSIRKSIQEFQAGNQINEQIFVPRAPFFATVRVLVFVFYVVGICGIAVYAILADN